MRRIAIGLLVLFALLGMAAPGSAQINSSGCVTFAGDQAAAQDWFEANGGSATNNFDDMDADGNGVACDEPGAFEGGGPSAGPEGGPSAGPESCADFVTQAEAQTYFENSGGITGDDRLNLDADGNGVACDELGTVGPAPVVRTGGDNTLSTSGSGESAAVVSALPSTGSDPVRGSWSPDARFVGGAALLLASAALGVRRVTAMRA